MAPCLVYLSWLGFYLRGADKTRRLVLSTCLHVGFTCVVLCLIYLSSRGFYLRGALSYLPVFTWVLPAWCRQDTAPCLIYLSSRGFYLRGADTTRCLVSSTCLHVGFTCVVPTRHGTVEITPFIQTTIPLLPHPPSLPPPTPPPLGDILRATFCTTSALVLHQTWPNLMTWKNKMPPQGAFLFPPPTVRYRRKRAAWGRQALADCPVGEALITPVIAGAAAPQCFILPHTISFTVPGVCLGPKKTPSLRGTQFNEAREPTTPPVSPYRWKAGGRTAKEKLWPMQVLLVNVGPCMNHTHTHLHGSCSVSEKRKRDKKAVREKN